MRFLEILFDKRIWTGATFSLALAVPAIGQEGIKVLRNSADPVGKDQINLSDGRVCFAKITCSNTNLTLNQIKPDARDWMGNFDFNLKTYVQLVGLNGILPVQKNAANAASVELKDAEGNPLTQVAVEGVQFKPMIAPVMVLTKTNSALSFTNAQSIMCDNPAFYFRYSNETPALVVWAELVSNKNRFKILQDILSPAAIAIDSVLHAVLDKTVPGLQSTTKIATFSTALGSLISAFDKKEMRTNSVLLRHGDNFVNMSGLDLNVRIMDPDRGLDGREFGPADRSFLTGQVPFPTSWGDFLGGVEQEKLRKAADHKDTVGECVAIRNALYSPDPTKRTLSDIDTAFAILASFRGSRVTANNAYACLDQELACASRDFTNPANARKTGVWGIVSSRIETKYFFEQTIEGFDEICEEYDKTREPDAAGEEGSRIKERKAAEAAAKVLRAKRAALYSSADAHSAKGATFFVRGSDNKSGLEKFTS